MTLLALKSAISPWAIQVVQTRNKLYVASTSFDRSHQELINQAIKELKNFLIFYFQYFF